MPKPDDAKVRKAMLSDEVDPQDEPRDIAPAATSWKDAPPAAPVTPDPVPVVAVAPVAPPLDANALIQMLSAALQQSGQSTAQAIKDGLASATAMAREPIPENKVPLDRGVYANPNGGPRTKLLFPMFLGAYDERGKATAVFEIFEAACRESERVLLNQVQPGEYWVERNDDAKAIWKVVDEKDSLGQVTRRVIAVPTQWLSTSEQHAMPSQTRFLQQLTAPAEAAA